MSMYSFCLDCSCTNGWKYSRWILQACSIIWILYSKSLKQSQQPQLAQYDGKVRVTAACEICKALHISSTFHLEIKLTEIGW